MSGVAAMLPFDDWQADSGPVDTSPVLAVPAMSTEGSDPPANARHGGKVITRDAAVAEVGGRATGEREAAERAAHLARVCASFPTKISERSAVRLARLLASDG